MWIKNQLQSCVSKNIDVDKLFIYQLLIAAIITILDVDITRFAFFFTIDCEWIYCAGSFVQNVER